MADNGVGRNSYFGEGAYEVKYPSFHTEQQNPDYGRFKWHTVYGQSQIMPQLNGMSADDRTRATVNGLQPSPNGQSRDTFEKRLWLDTPYRTFG